MSKKVIIGIGVVAVIIISIIGLFTPDNSGTSGSVFQGGSGSVFDQNPVVTTITTTGDADIGGNAVVTGDVSAVDITASGTTQSKYLHVTDGTRSFSVGYWTDPMYGITMPVLSGVNDYNDQFAIDGGLFIKESDAGAVPEIILFGKDDFATEYASIKYSPTDDALLLTGAPVAVSEGLGIYDGTNDTTLDQSGVDFSITNNETNGDIDLIPNGTGTVDVTGGMTQSGDVLTINDVAIKRSSAALIHFRNAADDGYVSTRGANDTLSGALIAADDNLVIRTNNSSTGAITFQAKDGTSLATVAMAACSTGTNSQYFSLGGNDEFTVTNAGIITANKAIYMAEQAGSPTAIADTGAIYTKSTNHLYFQDGDGVEHEVAISDTNLAGMYIDTATTMTVETANTPHAALGMTASELNGWTYQSGTSHAITAYANNGGTVAGTVKATSALHALTTGDWVAIRGSTNYNGVFQVTVLTVDRFYFTDTWVADDGASDFERGDALIAGAGAGGIYSIQMYGSFSEGGGAGSTIIGRMYVNGTTYERMRAERKFANNDVGSMAGGGNLTIVDGDIYWIAMESSGNNDLSAKIINLSLHRL